MVLMVGWFCCSLPEGWRSRRLTDLLVLSLQLRLWSRFGARNQALELPHISYSCSTRLSGGAPCGLAAPRPPCAQRMGEEALFLTRLRFTPNWANRERVPAGPFSLPAPGSDTGSPDSLRKRREAPNRALSNHFQAALAGRSLTGIS